MKEKPFNEEAFDAAFSNLIQDGCLDTDGNGNYKINEKGKKKLAELKAQKEKEGKTVNKKWYQFWK